MKATTQKVLGTLAIGGLLLLGFDYATYAANGDSLLLGRANTAGKTTTVSNNGTGPALRLKTRAGAPPLSVSSTKKVKKLNADTLDGVHAGALRKVKAGRFVDADVSSTWSLRTWDIPAPAPGAYLVSFTTGIAPTSGTAAAPNATECLVQDVGGTFLADMTTYDGGFVPLMGAATVHPVTEESQLSIVCGTEAAGPNRLFFPLVVSLTRLDGETTTPLPVPATAPAPRQGARAIR